MPSYNSKASFALRHLIITSLFSTAATIPVFAEEEIPTIVISATRYEENVESLGSSISVVGGEELKERNDMLLSDSIRSVPGIQVTGSGGPGKTTSVFMRGASAAQTLILVDGIPVNENLSGQFDFGDFSALGVEQIEVVRGSQSLMYGSDAMGGVINIVTARPTEEAGLQGTLGGGNYGYQKYTLKGDTGGENLRGNVYGSYSSLDGISTAVASETNTEDDPYENMTVGTAVEANISDVKISPSFRYSKSNTSLDGFDYVEGAVDALDYIQHRDTLQSSVKVEKEGDTFSPSLILGLTNDSFDAHDPVVSFNTYDFSSKTYTVQAQNLYKYSEELKLLTGYSYEGNQGKNVGSFDKSRDVNSLYANLMLAPMKGTDIGLGARYDHNSSFGDIGTYRATLSQDVDPLASRIHTSFGTGFRAPTFSDLYFPGFSNPNLDAEKSTSYDLGLASKFGFISTDITGFYTRYKDLIAFNTETFIPENLARAQTYGVETSVKFDVSEYVEPSLTYTYLDSEDRDTHQALARRARHQGGASLKINPSEGLITRLDSFYLADRKDSTGANMDNYIVVNASVEYEFTKNIRPFIKGQNLLDNDYEEIPGYGTFGAFYYAGVELKM